MATEKAKVAAEAIDAALEARFGACPAIPEGLEGLAHLVPMAARGVTRHFRDEAVADDLIRFLAAIALSTPSKSDLQQRDIIIVSEPGLRARLDAMVGGQAWVAAAPVLLVFCGNNRRQRQIHELRGHRFANDHLDAFFNAAVDAGIALQGFVAAADAVGLGTCPISAIRNQSDEVGALLGLPAHVFPVAGLALGWPKFPSPRISQRLPLAATLHRDRFDETGIAETIENYDRSRAATQPYGAERLAERFPALGADYGWSEDKARQYSEPERETFGAYVRAQGFRLD